MINLLSPDHQENKKKNIQCSKYMPVVWLKFYCMTKPLNACMTAVIQTRAMERLHAQPGQTCGLRVKLSSHYHTDRRPDNGAPICSCQP